MAEVSLVQGANLGVYSYPGFLPQNPQTNYFFTLDADGEKGCYTFRVPKTGTIDSAAITFRAVAQAPASGLKVSLQDVGLVGSITGVPDGTADEYRVIPQGSIVANTTIDTGLLTDDGTDLGNKRTVTEGDYLSVVCEFESYADGDDVDIAWENQSVHGILDDSWPNLYNGTVWAQAQNSRNIHVALKYDGDINYTPVTRHYAVPSTTYQSFGINSGTNPDEVCVRFQVPVKCNLMGVYLAVSTHLTNFDLVLYNDASTVLKTETKELTKSAERSNTQTNHFFWYSSKYELDADTWYRIAVKPTTASNMTITTKNFTSAAFNVAAPGGAYWQYFERQNGGSWTELDTERLMLTLVISDIDVSSGSGGGSGGAIHIPYYRF